MGLLTSPPNRLVRAFFAAPLWLYRLHLGWLLGHRFARLTHRGRRSGRIHQTVVEVLRYDPATHEVVVASGWGGRTDWHRNILAAPALEVVTGRVRFQPTQRFLTADQMLAEVCSYQRRRPWIARRLFPQLLGVSMSAPESELRARIDAILCGVALRPRSTADGGVSRIHGRTHEAAPGVAVDQATAEASGASDPRGGGGLIER